MTEDDTPTIESCIHTAADEARYMPGEIQQLFAELAELRRKATLTDRLASEVLHHRARRIWDESYSATSATAEARARARMVEEGLLPKVSEVS